MTEEEKKKARKAATELNSMRMNQLVDKEEPKKASREPAVKKEEVKALKKEATKRAQIISDHKVEIMESAVENKDITEKQTKQLARHLDNKKSVQKSAEKALGVTKSSKSSSTADSFKEALTFFAPQLIGGLVGGAMEGDVGAIEGFEKGGQLRDSYIDYRQQGVENLREEKKLNLAEKKAMAGPATKPFQQLRDAFIKDKDGNMVPAVYDSINNNIMNPITKEVIKSGDQMTTGEARRLQQASSLSDTQVNMVKGFENSIKALDTIDFLKKNVNTGFIAGRLQSVGALADLSSNEFVELRVETENAKADFLKAMSGAQVSDAEARRLANIIPTINDDDNTFASKSKAFRQILQRHRTSIAEAISSGQPLRADVLEDMRNTVKQAGYGGADDHQVDTQSQINMVDAILARRNK